MDGYGYGWILCITGYHIDAGWERDGMGKGWVGMGWKKEDKKRMMGSSSHPHSLTH
jgi:hypothetical protein